MRTQSRSSNDLDLLSRWALAVLLATALLTVGYTIIYTAAEVDQTRAHLTGTLPANYRDTLKAVLQSAGATCREVCDLTASDVAPNKTKFRISCATASTANACASTEDYLLTLEPSPVPSR